MQRYLIRRILSMIPLLLGVSIIAFVIMNLAPGDPAIMYMDPNEPFDQTTLDAIRVRMGLDQPLPVRYLSWLGRTVRGDLGYSFVSRRPVIEEITARLPNTLLLAVTSLTISLLLGSLIGVYSALNRYRVSDYAITVVAFIGLSTPGFWLALMMIVLFSGYLGWLPSVGMRSARVEPGMINEMIDVGRHMIMPIIALSMPSIASWCRYVRSSMLEVLDQDYIRTARSKGLPGRVVVGRHALRNAVIPIITLFGMSIGGIVGGSVLIETVFSWPGMGRLGVNAIFSRDFPVVMGVTLLGSMLVMMGNLISDVMYALVDPRIRY